MQGHAVNLTTIFLSWQPPLTQHRNGIIRYYHIEVIDYYTHNGYRHYSYDMFLLVGNLQPDSTYSCMITAYTVGMGPTSEPVLVHTHHDDSIAYRPLQSQNQYSVYALGTSTGTLLILTIILGLTTGICTYSYCKKTRGKRYDVQNYWCYSITLTVSILHYLHHRDSTPNVYDEPSLRTCREQPTQVIVNKPNREVELCIPMRRRKESEDHDYHDDTPTPPIPPREYLFPLARENKEGLELQCLGSSKAACPQNPAAESGGIYQPLIPPRQIPGNESSELYQSLGTHLRQHNASSS